MHLCSFYCTLKTNKQLKRCTHRVLQKSIDCKHRNQLKRCFIESVGRQIHCQWHQAFRASRLDEGVYRTLALPFVVYVFCWSGAGIRGIVLFAQQLRMPASFAMAFIMIGAIATTIVSGQFVNVAICFAILVLCMVVFKHRIEQLAAELLDTYTF